MDDHVRCMDCDEVLNVSDLKSSWEVNDATIDEPYAVCPSCGGSEFYDVEEYTTGEYVCTECAFSKGGCNVKVSLLTDDFTAPSSSCAIDGEGNAEWKEISLETEWKNK